MDAPAIALTRRDEAFCLCHHVRKLSLFGSILTSRFHAGSSIDMFVEFDTGHVPGYFGLIGMNMELPRCWVGRSTFVHSTN